MKANPVFKELNTGLVKTAKGEYIATYGYEDPYYNDAPGLLCSFDNGGTLADITCNGVNAGTAQIGQGMLDDFIPDLVTMLFKKAEAEGINISGYASTGTIAASFVTFMNNWMSAYRIIAGMRSVLQLGGYNKASEAVSAALTNRLDEINARTKRLASWCVPQAFVSMLDKVTGVYMPDGLSAPPLLVMGGTNAVANLDLTNDSIITTFFTTFDTNITNIRGIVNADLANISRVMAFLYKSFPNLDTSNLVHRGDQNYFMSLAKGMCHGRTATVDTFPNLNSAIGGGRFPLLIFGNAKTIDPQWVSFIRQAVVYSNTGVAETANTPFGMFDTQAGLAGTAGSFWCTYDEDGGFHVHANGSLYDAGGAGVITLADEPAFDVPFAAPAILGTAAGSYASDIRSLPGYERYYVDIPMMMDNTIRLLSMAFGL